jgi:hypothetical protein
MKFFALPMVAMLLLVSGCSTTPISRQTASSIPSPVNVVLSPGVTALIPVPVGLTLVTVDESPRLTAGLRALQGDRATLLAGFAEHTFILAVNNGQSSQSSRFATVVQPNDPRLYDVPLALFQKAITAFKTRDIQLIAQMATSANEYDAKHPDVLKQGSISPSTRVAASGRPVVSIDIPHAYGSVIVGATKTNASTVPMVIGMTHLLVKGHMIAEGTYMNGNTPSTVDAVKKMAADFAIATLRANGEPTN